jgi:hypothetical protein
MSVFDFIQGQDMGDIEELLTDDPSASWMYWSQSISCSLL